MRQPGYQLFEHEEPSSSKLRAMIHELFKDAGRTEPQLAHKLLKALRR